MQRKITTAQAARQASGDAGLQPVLRRRTVAVTGHPTELQKPVVLEPTDHQRKDRMADRAIDPSVSAAIIAHKYLASPGGELTISALVESLRTQIEALRADDTTFSEAMLLSQATSLQAIFTRLALAAEAKNDTKDREAYLRMALRAQNQCRMTLESLAVIRNPPVVFARQANINTGGQQQVNNGLAAARHGDARDGG
jgi:hypothetical protein